MINAIAIDDEPVALDIIRMHAARVPFVELKQTFSSAAQALEYLKNETPDLVFLDINMPGIGGLEFAALIDPAIQVVFTTAHTAFALAGFDMAITDFLLKPINYPRFLQACSLAKARINTVDKQLTGTDTLFVKDGYNWVKIDLKELLYIKAEDNYISLVMANRHILTRMPLQEALGKLPAGRFLKVHKSYIVNTGLIEQLENHQLLIGGQKIPVAKSFMEALKRQLMI
jgi:two-component system LytT family response regulator